MDEVVELLSKYSKNVDKELYEVLSSIIPQELFEATIYLSKAGGKKLRPALAMISSEAVGGSIDNAIEVATAIELIHTFSLIHDDIMDKDEMRRGKPSVHMVWGEPIAILAGDTLFSKAFEAVLMAEHDGVSFEKVNSALRVVVDSCIQICEGQALDMGFEGNFNVSEEEYLDMIYKKTSALIAAATKAGAIVGGGNSEQINALFEYGGLIGLAFQIQDDYLDLMSDEESLGKPVGSDIVEGKMTLMVVNALEKASSEDAEILLEILKEQDPEKVNVAKAMEIMEKYGSIQYTYNVALENVNKAKKLLDILDDSQAKKELLLLADFVISRLN